MPLPILGTTTRTSLEVTDSSSPTSCLNPRACKPSQEGMGQIRIGAGGWDYFNIPNGDRLKAYSSAYDFVEVNRSEEHTSELQSPCNLVCRLLLEKKKKKTK